MNEQQTPLEIEGVTENIYAGFWRRFGALWLDVIFVLPVILFIQFFNSLNKDIYFITLIPNLLFLLWYNIYLPKQYGGTPGKLAVGIKIIRIDGYSIGWNEAILRHIVMLALSVLSSIMLAVSVLEADNDIFTNLGWLEQSQYLAARTPVYTKIHSWVSNIWVYSEMIVLLLNDRKRAIHDFIAGTVIVKDKYIDKIQEVMNITDEETEMPGVNPA